MSDTHTHYEGQYAGSYLYRMRNAPQFARFNLEPQWTPGIGDIDGFIHDEVVRQGHDTRSDNDGGRRIRWMRAAWDYAVAQSFDGGLPDMDDILRIGATVEPSMNSTIGFRVQNVWIGDNTGAPPGYINEVMMYLVQRVQNVRPEEGRIGPHADDYRNLWKNLREESSTHRVFLSKFAELTKQIETADDWYLCFEAIHPFGDGNGRSGKILYNWLLGTLEEPVLVTNYFGGYNG